MTLFGADRLTSTVLLFAALCLAVGDVCAEEIAAGRTRCPNAPVTLADDAYHYAEWADGRHDLTYTEWWYFNVVDVRAGVQAIFSYFISDPSNLLGVGQARMVAVAYTPRGIVSAIDGFAPAVFSASVRRADVTIDANTIRVNEDGTYRIEGVSLDGRLAWNLAFAPQAAPWFAADRLPVGRAAWETMSWLVFMPRAQVVGQVRVDDQTFEVEAPGYHDHNWGEWIPTNGLWNWAQYSDERVALEVGDFAGKPVGRVAIDVDGRRVVFAPNDYRLTHTRWTWDRVNHAFYPVESVLAAQNEAVRVRVTLRAAETEPLRGDLPFLPADLIIYEQTARYVGRVWTRTSGGRWRKRASFAGWGFKEYTAASR